MEYKHYIGVDVSKKTIDVTVLEDGTFLSHEKVTNDKTEIRQLLKRIFNEHKIRTKKTIFCVENSGTYTTLLLDELFRKKLPLWLESALQIKLTLGLHRGKSDKIDSLRIAQYAYTHRKKSKIWHQPRDIIEQLRKLRSLRERLLTAKMQLKTESKEITAFIKKKISSSVLIHCQASLDAITQDIAQVDKSMMDIIIADERLNQIFEWISSITSVGKVLATELLITTNEFKNFTSSKKFACHCGVAPFGYSSGTSLKTKSKVSKWGNKRMKALLTISAMSSLRYDNDYKRYFDRRVAQGLNKMSVLNVIRNKIIHRVFACVRDQRPYVKKIAQKSIIESVARIS